MAFFKMHLSKSHAYSQFWRSNLYREWEFSNSDRFWWQKLLILSSISCIPCSVGQRELVVLSNMICICFWFENVLIAGISILKKVDGISAFWGLENTTTRGPWAVTQPFRSYIYKFAYGIFYLVPEFKI